VALQVQKEFEEAVHLDPSNISARRDLQKFYMMAPWIINGREKASEMVDAIAALDAVEGHLARAQLYLKNLKKPDLGENEYILALDGRPNRPEPYFEIAAFYEDRKNGSAVKIIMEYAEQADPADPRLAYYRGVAGVLINDDLETAEESLKSYLAGSPERSDWPSHAAAYEWLGRLYEQEEELVEAIEQYRAALKIEPERKEAGERLERLEKLVRQRGDSARTPPSFCGNHARLL
jgi:tetratricopeptide (TPR) repeat protein